MQTEPVMDAPATPAPAVSLRDELAAMIRAEWPDDCESIADAVMQLLMERGHYLPGAPPAQQILNDAKSFAERLTLSNLALRILNMLAWQTIQNPESKPARKWIDDYLAGKQHGPVGKPMLWPSGLPGMASMLRDWGFVPTPTTPAFVSRALPNPTQQ